MRPARWTQHVSSARTASRKETIRATKSGSKEMWEDAVTAEIPLLGLKMDSALITKATQLAVKSY